MSEKEQLGALGRLHELFERAGIDYWLFGGWAVDFHAGAISRPQADLDIAVCGKPICRGWTSCSPPRAGRTRRSPGRTAARSKSQQREDAQAAAKDRADLETLEQA